LSETAAIIIPIKTNNQRLPGKNTMMLGDRPLYDYLFKTVKACKNVSEIFVDSSDEKILKIAEKEGFTAIRRPVWLNTPETSGNDLLSFESGFIDHPIICQCFVTMPFLRAKTIDKAISSLMGHEKKTSVFGVCKIENRFWHRGKPINHKFDELVGTQYVDPLFQESGFYAFRKDAFLKEGSRITRDHMMIDVDLSECVDIDTKYDFLYATAMLRSEGDS